MAPGDYPLTTTLFTQVPITIHGVAGQPRPRLFFSGPGQMGLHLANDSTLRYVEVDQERDDASALYVLQVFGGAGDCEGGRPARDGADPEQHDPQQHRRGVGGQRGRASDHLDGWDDPRYVSQRDRDRDRRRGSGDPGGGERPVRIRGHPRKERDRPRRARRPQPRGHKRQLGGHRHHHRRPLQLAREIDHRNQGLDRGRRRQPELRSRLRERGSGRLPPGTRIPDDRRRPGRGHQRRIRRRRRPAPDRRDRHRRRRVRRRPGGDHRAGQRRHRPLGDAERQRRRQGRSRQLPLRVRASRPPTAAPPPPPMRAPASRSPRRPSAA